MGNESCAAIQLPFLEQHSAAAAKKPLWSFILSSWLRQLLLVDVGKEIWICQVSMYHYLKYFTMPTVLKWRFLDDEKSSLNPVFVVVLLQPFQLFWNILVCFGIFWNILEYFGIFWNILEYFGIFLECFGIFLNYWNILEYFGIFLNILDILEYFRIFLNILEYSWIFWNILEYFEIFSNLVPLVLPVVYVVWRRKFFQSCCR